MSGVNVDVDSPGGGRAGAASDRVAAGPFRAGTGAVVPRVEGVAEAELAASFAACREITRRAARNFYYGLKLTPEPRRSAVFSIYAWMRAADDQVDSAGTMDQKRQRLERYRARTAAVLAGDVGPKPGPTGEPEAWWPAFAATLASYPVDRAWIDDMLAGLEEDLDHQGYRDRRELDRYCYRVGSTVGLTCVSIWGLRAGADASAARTLAIARGRAFQLTNILRDVKQDYDDQPRRVYVAQEDLSRFGLSPEALRAWNPAERCERFILEQADRAEGLYRESEPLEGLIDPACAPALWGMTRIYHGLLRIIRSEPARVMGPRRIRLSSARKGLIALSAAWRARQAARHGDGHAAQPAPEAGA